MNALIMSIFFFVIFFSNYLTSSADTIIGTPCLSDCDEDDYECLFCVIPKCMRTKPLLPTTQVKGLAYNKYSWLTTHNSFARNTMLPGGNQEDSIRAQLDSGIRGLMLDFYDFEGAIWACHGNCSRGITTYRKAEDLLKEVRGFLESNPSEIITIFIEDYVKEKSGLKKLFQNEGLSKYLFPANRMPQNGGDWPTVDTMVSNNFRLVVFTSNKDKETEEEGYIAFQWKYVLENQYGADGLIPGSCEERSESSREKGRSRSLFLMNHFPGIGLIATACVDNSSPLMEMIDTCHNAMANRWPNFIAVDYYKRSNNGGGAAQAVGYANGKMICGCNSTMKCQGKFSSKGLCG